MSTLSLVIACVLSDVDEARLRELASRCGSEIRWCQTWTEAAERARRESKLVLVVYENYTILNVPKTAKSGPFMDPDLVALVQERFVALPMSANDPAPFRSEQAFGMSEFSWGTSYLFVRPIGEVVCETGIENASYLAQVARDVLRDEPPNSVAARQDPLARAEKHLRRGELERAAEVLKGSSSARGHFLRAAMHRQLREGDRALSELRAARPRADKDLAAAIAIEESVILMRQAKFAEAQRGFTKAIDEYPNDPRVPEALYWLGAFDVLSDEQESPHWRRLVEAHPENRWAWKAAADLLQIGAFINGGERLDWPEPELVRSVTRPRAASAELLQAEREAVAYLIANQRPDGSWLCPSDAFSIGSNLYTPAMTAICAWSLIPFADEEAVDSAIQRALAYALQAQRSGKLDPHEGIAGVYSIWSRTFVLSFLSQCVRAKIGDEQELRRVLDALAASIASSQYQSGGWPYVAFPSDGSVALLDPSTSFLSAGVLLTLIEARDNRASVARETLARGSNFLKKMREKTGLYRYFPDVPQGEAFSEAAGRGPLCALALRRSGLGSIELIREALELFCRERRGFAKVWHKELCHTGPEGFGSHYLFYDYYFACCAVRELPPQERSTFRSLLLQDMLAARFADGSFEDMPGLGRPYATGMALLALRELEAE